MPVEKFENNKYIKHIKSLLNPINKSMSVLVGAGFSKNANPNYPSWTELLIEMFAEIENIEGEERKRLEKDVISKKIKKKGHSNVVDEYIKKKRHRESVDIYIESVFSKINKEDVDLRIHELLLNVEWNNIYTTNYDTLLEDCNKQISELKSSKNRYQVVKSSKDLQIGPFRRIIKLHGTLRNEDDKKEKVFGFDGCRKHHYIISSDDYDTYPEKHQAFTQLMRIALLQEKFCLFGFSATDPNFTSWIEWVKEILEQNVAQKSREKKISEQESSEEQCDLDRYSTFLFDVSEDEISESQEQHFFNLGIKNIKLRDFFLGKNPSKDGEKDAGKVTKEHMITELLKFLQPDNKTDEEESKKDHITAETEIKTAAEASKANYYADITSMSNNNIQKEAEPKKTEKEKDEYLKLWTELYKIAIDLKRENKDLFLELLEQMQKKEHLFRIAAEYEETRATIVISKMLQYLNIVNENNEKLTLYSYLATAINTSYKTSTLLLESRQVGNALNAFKEIVPQKLSEKNKKKWIKFATVLLKSYRLANKKEDFFHLRDQIIENNNFSKYTENEIVYQECILYIMNFEFEKTFKTLENWELDEDDEAQWLIKKAYAYRIINELEKARDIVNQAYVKIKNNEQESHETLINLEIIDFYKQSKDYEIDKSVQDVISNKKNKNHIPIQKIVSSALKKIQEERTYEKVMPLGEESQTVRQVNPSESRSKALALSELLIEAGYPVSISNMVSINDYDWNKVHRILCQSQHFLTSAIHSFQYGGYDSNENTITRFAQDIAFLEHIDIETKKIIMKNMWQSFNYLLKTRNNYQKKYLFIIAEFSKVVPFKVWHSEFSELWNNLVEKQPEFNRIFKKHHGIIKPLQTFIRFLEDKDTLEKMALWILKYSLSPNEEKFEKAIEMMAGQDHMNENSYKSVKRRYLYFLQNNKAFALSKKKRKELIENILKVNDLSFNELVWIYYLIPKDDLNKLGSDTLGKINNTLENYIKNKNHEGHHYKLFVHLSMNNNKIKTLIKEQIFKSDYYFTGIHEDGVTYSGRAVIKISDLLKNSVFTQGLELTKTEENMISEKITETIKTVNDYNKKFNMGATGHNYYVYSNYPLYLEMSVFLQKAKHIGQNQKKELLDKIDKLILENSNMKSYEEGLFSNESDKYDTFLNKVITEYNVKSYSYLKEHLDTIILSLAMKRNPKAERTIEFIAEIIETKPFEEILSEKSKEKYISLLEQYFISLPENTEYDKILLSINRIVKALKKHNIDDSILEMWQNKLANNQFIEVQKAAEQK